MSKDSTASLFESVAGLLEYPVLNIKEQAGQCLAQLQPVHPEVAVMLQKFASGMEGHSLQRMQELYTTTFDMQPMCYPYVGYHLFSESYKRGAFMAQLNEAYHTLGYSAGQELPDHLPIILRFLGLKANEPADEFCRALLINGLLPALEKMLQVFGAESENPYFALLSALQLLLVQTLEKDLSHA